MLHPILDLSSVNVVVTFAGKSFLAILGPANTDRTVSSCVRTDLDQSQADVVSRRSMYVTCGLSKANANSTVPAFVIGALLGPFCANLINIRNWTDQDEEGEIAYVSAHR